MSCSLLMMSGDVRVAQLEPGESFRVVSVLLLFCFGKLVLANVWLAMLMQEYHTARVEAGSSSAYKWRDRPLQWMHAGTKWEAQIIRRFTVSL
eukprot:g11853.t1